MRQIPCAACGTVIAFEAHLERDAVCETCGHRPFRRHSLKDTVALPKFLDDTIAAVIPHRRPSDQLGSNRLYLPKDRRYYLEIQNGAFAGSRFVIDHPSMILGRGEEADIVLGDRGISRRHARLDVSGTQLRLTDLDTANGTFVGMERIKVAEITAGTEFTIAVTRILLQQNNFF